MPAMHCPGGLRGDDFIVGGTTDDFIDGLDNIIETQRRVALNYFTDGSVPSAASLAAVKGRGLE